MKLDVMQPIVDEMGDPIQMPTGPMLMRHAIARALNAAGANYEQVTPEEKYKRGKLAVACMSAPVVDLAAEDVVMIKRLAAASLLPVVYFQVANAIDPPS